MGTRHNKRCGYTNYRRKKKGIGASSGGHMAHKRSAWYEVTTEYDNSGKAAKKADVAGFVKTKTQPQKELTSTA